MAFKEFQRKRTHGGEAAVTITHFGNFALNSKTVAQYFQGNRYAKLYWDDESKRVGIKPLKKSFGRVGEWDLRHFSKEKFEEMLQKLSKIG